VVDFTLEIHERHESGSAGTRRVRRQGFIPGVAYHRGEESLQVQVPYNEFVHLAQAARPSQVFSLKSISGKLNGKAVIVKEIQKDYLSGQVLHVDFQTLKEDEELVVRVTVHFNGEPTGVKNQGGILTIATHEIGVSCLPKDIPASIEVDVTGLALGDSIHARDINLPEGVTLVDNPEETIVSVVATRQSDSGDAAAPAGAAGAAASPAGAAAPAGDAAAPAAPAAGAKKDAKAAPAAAAAPAKKK
jgi:large subunit ribosomal protein L25